MMKSNVSANQGKEGLSHSCHPGRGLEPIPRAGLKLSLEINRGVTNHPRPVLAPGSALGLLLSIALSSGQASFTVNKNGLPLQSQPNAGFQKEDISNELRMRTFLKSCDTTGCNFS
jgi:hypothetical protein